MGVKLGGQFKHLRCRLGAWIPLDWGAVSATNIRDLDFKPISLTDPVRTTSLDFGMIKQNYTPSSST
jgi:hypothetical protein